jgi:c-di-GMP-binding flagellar brake protein YcgR
VNDERRREKRAPVLVEVLWEGNTGHYNARTSDLSMGGCFIDTIGRVTSGEKLRFKLRLPDEEWVEVEGTVTYAYPNVGFGVQFTNVSEIDKKKLEKLVKPDTHEDKKV